MPILMGFPASNTISPSVRIREQDFTFTGVQPTTSTPGIVGFATKGPINVPTLITSINQLHTVFGYAYPDTSDPYLIYAAEQALQLTTKVYVVRCGQTLISSGDYAETASVEIPSAGGLVNIIGNVVGPYTFSDNAFFSWRLNGVLASKVLVLLAGTYSAAQVVSQLNSQLIAGDGIQFFVSSNVTVGVQTTFSFGTGASIELVSVQSPIYGPSSLLGLGTSMTYAVATGGVGMYPNNSYQTAGNYNLVSFVNLNLQVVVDGTQNINIDNVVQVVTIPNTNTTAAAIASNINAQITGASIPGGFVASATGGGNLVLTTLSSGRDSSILVKAASTAGAIFGFANATVAGGSPTAVANQDPDVTYAAGIVSGSSASSGMYTFEIVADSPGTTGNLTQVVIANDIRSGTFSMQVFSNGVAVESWSLLSKDPTQSGYVETFIALVSNYIQVIDNTAIAALPLPGTYSLSGGTDGIPADADDQDDLIIGDTTSFVGLYALSNPESVDIDLFAVPGHSSTAVVLAGLDLCQNQRQDCLFIVDPPFGLSVNEIVQWVNGQHPLNLTRLDNDFGALYWPWVQIYDTYNQINVWIPPSGPILATIANSDNISFPWYAPAGETRGVVFNILETYSEPSLAERDLMYGNQNCINPIISFADLANFVVWGQKTMQRLPTALDRVNVRRMLLYVEKLIKIQARGLLFQPDDTILQQQFVTIVSAVLDNVVTNRGVYAYQVQCDSTINTPATMDRNELWANIGLQPTRAAEFIYITFQLFNTGSFTEPANTFN